MTDFSIDSDMLKEDERKDAECLLARRDDIVRSLVVNGLVEDEESPYTYFVPTAPAFSCGHGRLLLRALWAVVLMARASGARAYFLDCDKEGLPELPQFTGGREGFHRVCITDPFAQLLDMAIEAYREEQIRSGKARIVNGKFFKVA